MTELVDTNVIARYLVGDIKIQQDQATQWFKEAENGKRQLAVYPLVIAETCFVLESFYQVPRADIAAKMEVFLSQRWLQVKNRPELLGLWPYYLKGYHFVDSYLISAARDQKGSILTFDKKLNKAISN